MAKVKKILIINAFYWPGFKSGGPQQSIMNLVDVFGNRATFHILTLNHDFRSNEPYSQVKSDEWNTVGKAKVFYSSSDAFSLRFLLKMTQGYDAIYLCEPYRAHSWKTLLLKKMGLIREKIYLAPMGCFSSGALSQKAFKKSIFWRIFDFLNLGNGITWSFTSDTERKEALCVLGEKNATDYLVATDLPRKYEDFRRLRAGQRKNKGEVKIVFLSRFSPQKKLDYALDLVKDLSGSVTFDLYGPIDDGKYWASCREKIKEMPDNVKCHYRGEVTPEDVVRVLSSYDCFLLPTLGENFGHVVYEALLSGSIPVISNNTPWNEIEQRGCGFVSDLSDRDAFIEKLKKIVSMEEPQIALYRERGYLFSKENYSRLVEESGYKRIL